MHIEQARDAVRGSESGTTAPLRLVTASCSLIRGGPEPTRLGGQRQREAVGEEEADTKARLVVPPPLKFLQIRVGSDVVHLVPVAALSSFTPGNILLIMFFKYFQLL